MGNQESDGSAHLDLARRVTCAHARPGYPIEPMAHSSVQGATMGVTLARQFRASVLISTRNRPEKLRRCLSTLLAVLPPLCEIVCVDQSDDPPVAGVVPRSRRLRYLPSPRRGLSAGRNDAAAESRGEILIFTDDDCHAPRGWVESWIDLFDRWPTVDVGFGPVSPAEPGRDGGATLDFEPSQFQPATRLTTFLRRPETLGIEGNMAIRRIAWRAVGGFDEEIGAGTRFAGAEGFDIAYRIVRARGALIHSPGPAIVHDGFQTATQMGRVSMGYCAGAAAVYMKHVRCGDPMGAAIAAINGWRLLRAPAAGLITGRRPLRLRLLWGYSVGLLTSLPLRIDRITRLYRSRRSALGSRLTTERRAYGGAIPAFKP
jgi:hypothetical protein